jgi:hypothetical protein
VRVDAERLDRNSGRASLLHKNSDVFEWLQHNRHKQIATAGIIASLGYRSAACAIGSRDDAGRRTIERIGAVDDGRQCV